MNFLVKNCKELNYGELLAVNGGCGGYCSGGYRVGITSGGTPNSDVSPNPNPKPNPNAYQAPTYAPRSYCPSCSALCSGGPTGAHNLFNQHMMKEYNSPYESEEKNTFTGKACATTSLLNEISDMYSKVTGKKLSESQAKDAIRAAVNAGGVREKDAFVRDWNIAANAMSKSVGLSGHWTFVTDAKKADAIILSIDTDGDGYHNHFVNYLGENKYYDPYTNKVGSVSNLKLTSAWKDDDGNVKIGSPYRYLDYNAQ